MKNEKKGNVEEIEKFYQLIESENWCEYEKENLFMLINMNVGGTEKALLNMISEMPKDRV